MALYLRSLALFASAAFGTAPAKVNYYTYATADAAASVLAPGYFNDARTKLKANDVIIAMCVADGAGDLVIIKATSVPSSGNVLVSTIDDAMAGNRAVTATADGLTTGLLTAADKKVDVTSASADNIVTLPPIADLAINDTIRLSVGATGHELRTPATSNTKINNVDADASEMAVPANSITVVTKQGADNWIAEVYVAAGTRTIPTPD